MRSPYALFGPRGRQVLVITIIILSSALISGPTSPVHPHPTAAQESVPFPPEGEWYTYANGDDILTLETQGTVLWAGTRAGGLVRWDVNDGSYVQYLKPQDGLAGNTVRDIFIDAEGHKWLATDDGLSVLDDGGTPDKADDVWFSYTRSTTQGHLPSDRVTAVAMDDAGFLWIGTSQYWDVATAAYVGGGLVKVDTKGTLDPSDDAWLQTYTLANTRSRSGSDIHLGLVSDNITDILPVPGNRVWIATWKHWDFRQFDSDPGEWRPIYGGLSRLDHAGTPETEDDVWQAWTCEAGPQRAVAVSCIVNQLRLDANGYVWAAMRGRGAIAFPYDGVQGLDYVWFRTSDGLASNNVAAIAFGPSDDPPWRNTVWFGTDQGVSVLDHQGTPEAKLDDTWNPQSPGHGQPITVDTGLPANQIQALAVSAGKAWLGVGDRWGKAHGINVFDLGQSTLRMPLKTADSGMPYNYVTDLAIGEPGTQWEDQVWVATGNRRERRYGAGALLLDTHGTDDPSDDTWSRFTRASTDDDGQEPWTGLASDNVTRLAIDHDDVWLGTLAATWNDRERRYVQGGLSVYDGEQWTTRTAENTGGYTVGLRDDRISALALGCSEEVWLGLGGFHGNSGLGLHVLDTKGSPHDRANDSWWEPMTYRDIPSNLITGIVSDCARDQLWISAVPYFNGFNMTGGGVARYDYNTGRWDAWTANDGLETYAQAGSSGNGITGEVQSIAVGPDGRVWAGTWGTRSLTAAGLSGAWPYVPAVLNWFDHSAWSNQVFENDGWVSSIAIDGYGVVWAGTSRGGMDFDVDGNEDDSLADKATGGIKFTPDGTEWVTWSPTNSPLVTNDIEVIKVSSTGDVWIGTNGWGIMRFRPRLALGATPTPTFTKAPLLPSPTPSVTATPVVPTATMTPMPSLTPVRRTHHAFMPLLAANWIGQGLPAATTVPPTPTATPSVTPAVTATATPTPTPPATSTPTPVPPSATPTKTPTLSPTNTPTITTTPQPAVWCSNTDPLCRGVSFPAFPAKDLFDVAFADAQHGLIVGENGFLATTSDGGNNWAINALGATTLRDVAMVSARVAFVVGDNKTIWQTTDGGDTFVKMTLPGPLVTQQEDFRAVYAISENEAWVMGHRIGAILKWDGRRWDFGGGAQWTGYAYTGLTLPTAELGWAISETGHIYRYYNGRWSLAPTIRASGGLRAIAMSSPTEGWAAGDYGAVMRYAHGRWTDSRINRPFYGGGVTGLYVTAAGDVWASAGLDTGAEAEGAIFRYHSGAWEQVAHTPVTQLNAIWVDDSLTSGWAVGNHGLVMRYVIP